MTENMNDLVREYVVKHGIRGVNDIKKALYEHSPMKHNPVDCVQWIPLEQVEANDYNPNAVASNELRLLSVSIDHDGYTQPIVAIFDVKTEKYVIVDGFHRYFVMKTNKKIGEKNQNLLPVVVLSKDINDRMASTIRHNRARGKHSVGGMGSVIHKMMENSWTDEQICDELGLEPDEFVRLKHVTGIAKLFADRAFNKSYKEKGQIMSERSPK